MNIFVLDNDINRCVQYYVDAHVNKMILESAQLLCTTHWATGNKAPYKLTHLNHPISLWVRESKDNYLWLCELGLAIVREYEYRKGKTHASKKIIEWCKDNIPNLPSKGLTSHYLAMPDKYRTDDVVKSYRNYYQGDKQHLFKWTKRPKPNWLK